MTARFDGVIRTVLAATIASCGIATAASASTFSARETHRGLDVDRASNSPARLSTNGWFHGRGEPALVYREDGAAVAGIWPTAPDAAVVRRGTTEAAPVIGRVVPSWNDGQLSLTIEPAGAAAIRTTTFERVDGNGSLDRDEMTRSALAGSYRAALRTAAGADAGWLVVAVDAEGATRFTGDLPSAISPPLAAAAAAAVEDEVDYIYGNVTDVSPLRR